MPQQPFKIVENQQKKMPCNIEAEQAVIGSILVSNDIYLPNRVDHQVMLLHDFYVVNLFYEHHYNYQYDVVIYV